MKSTKTGDVYESFNSNKEMFDFNNYSTKSKYCDGSNILVIGKMKDETGGVAIEEFFGLKRKMYSFLVYNSKHIKAKVVNKNVVATISHNEYKETLLNNKCIKHPINRTKYHKIRTYEIKKISLSCFDNNIFIQNNGCNGY